MDKIKFEHLVVFEDNQVYARARDPETRRVSLFLINENTGEVYSRNGQIWEALYGESRAFVVSNIYNARHNQTIPIFIQRCAFGA